MKEKIKNYSKFDFDEVIKNTIKRLLVKKKICTVEEFDRVFNEETNKYIEVIKQYKANERKD